MAIYVAKSKSKKSFQNTPFSQNVHAEGGYAKFFCFLRVPPSGRLTFEFES